MNVDIAVGSTLAGFRVERLLGRGAMGAVHLTEDVHLHRKATAYRRLAEKLERNVAPFAAHSTPVLPEFFSARVACRVEQPVVGAADIGTLCIQKH